MHTYMWSWTSLTGNSRHYYFRCKGLTAQQVRLIWEAKKSVMNVAEYF
jgi:hypothetical protein